MSEVVPWPLLHRLGLVAVVLASTGIALRLAAGRRVSDALRRRLVMGVPLGSLLAGAGVLAVYLFVQHGLGHWYEPVVLPFRAWSYFSPVGMLFAGLAHVGPGHLYGNLVGTLTLGVAAEYAWGHFPTERGVSTFSSLRTNPFARALAFAVAAWAAGIVTAVFALGPVIGFSGVVFAFAGLALVRYPLGTVLALVAGRVLGLLRSALQDPIIGPVGPSPSFGGPWWSEIAIQGHAFGLLFGFVGGVLLFRRRDYTPDATRIWAATLLFAVSQSLWAVYMPAGNASYILYRAVGLAAVFALAALVAAGATGGDRTLVGSIDLSTREAATIVLAASVVAVGAVAIPYNTATVDGPGPELAGKPNVSVDGYQVYYAENVTHQYVASVDVPFTEATDVRTSGVIVVSDRREIWWPAVSRGRLGFTGEADVALGGLGWRESVVANRTGWDVLGDSPAYRVTLREQGGPQKLAFTSPPANVSATISGRNISVTPTGERFALVVSRQNETVGRALIPRGNRTVTAGGLTFRRNGTKIKVHDNRTRVTIAVKETYR